MGHSDLGDCDRISDRQFRSITGAARASGGNTIPMRIDNYVGSPIREPSDNVQMAAGSTAQRQGTINHSSDGYRVTGVIGINGPDLELFAGQQGRSNGQRRIAGTRRCQERRATGNHRNCSPSHSSSPAPLPSSALSRNAFLVATWRPAASPLRISTRPLLRCPIVTV